MAVSVRSLAKLGGRLDGLKKYLDRPLKIVGQLFLLAVILPLYKLYLLSAKLFSYFYAPHKSRHLLIHPFSRRYLTHAIIIIITFLALASNLNANEARREEVGQTSIVASLVTREDLGLIMEEGPLPAAKGSSRYLGQTAIGSQARITGLQEEETPDLTTVAGDSAVVRPLLSPVEEGLRQRDKIVYYTVQSGDTISGIAERFGITTYTIIWENNLSGYSVIQPGDKLAILPVSGIRHKVAKNETIAGIAKKYGVTADKIIEYNKLASADDIGVGETLMIPGGEKISAPAPTYALRTTVYRTAGNVPAATAASGKMNWPNSCRYISQYFGWRHAGLDIACNYGVAIYAAESGRVAVAQGGWNGGYGNTILLDHGGGVQTRYGHLSAIYVSVGEQVAKGQAIGAEGSTGRSTGPHLHFEVITGGVKRNPLSYIR